LPPLVKAAGDLDKIDGWLRSVLWNSELPGGDANAGSQSVEVHRTKGRLVFDDGEVKMVQGVREIFEIMDSAEKGDGAKGKLILIGRRLSSDGLQKSLARALGR
jgi:hypothetical protein